MVLAEPRSGVTVVPEDRAYGALVYRDDPVVTRIPRRDFADHPVTHRVMVAAGDQRSPRRRAQRSGMEIGVAQPGPCDAIHCRRRDHPAKS